MTPLIDIIGRRFGAYTVIGLESERNRFGQVRWLCRCDCGREQLIVGSHLKSRKGARSCILCARRNSKRTHGCTDTQEYRIWSGMKTRCKPGNIEKAHLYADRGIKVCDRWLSSFENFLADMGPRPSKGHSIDRINVNEGYGPTNCRWATSKEQGGNKRTPTGLEIELTKLRARLARYEAQFGVLLDVD